MQDRTSRAANLWTRTAAIACAMLAIALPRIAHAQYYAPPLTNTAIGERYHVELSGTLWNPSLLGTVSSEQFGQAGSDLDFVTDLGFEQTRFKDLRIVLRPGRKHRLRLQYTPISYTASTILQRTVTFNGIKFDAALPITSSFDWKVWRFGYEYDVIYRDRGFVGLFVEGRYTQFASSLVAPGRSEFTSAKAPLPAAGLAARGYVVRNIALNFEVSGFTLPQFDPKYQADYFDWNVSGIVNLSEYVGVEVGWRRMTTFINVENDQADFKFQGMWFGAAVRY